MTETRTQDQDDLERPRSSPDVGQIDAFDAGWNAHRTGLERETVRVLTADPKARGWALLGWDVRRDVAKTARPEGWPERCASCGASWTSIGFDVALGFTCRGCGGSDADE